jgi:hypothetical protein
MIRERRTEDKTGEKRREKDIEEQGEKEAPFHSYMIPPNLEGKRGKKEERKGKRDTKEKVICS